MLVLSKIEKWQKRAKISGKPIAAKNMNPGVLSYRGQQWGAGANNNGPVGRKKRFNPNGGPGRK